MNINTKIWLWFDRGLLICAIVLAMAVGAVGLYQRFAVRLGSSAAEVVAEPRAPEVAPQRPIAVPQGGASWVTYGRRAAECGDRRGEWAQRGVTRGEWQGAPAAPAVDVEPVPGGYAVWCMLPEDAARDAQLNLEGNVLLVGCCNDKSGCTSCIRLRLPGEGTKRISDTSFSNGWLRVMVKGDLE